MAARGSKKPKNIEKPSAKPRTKHRIPRALKKKKHVLVPKTNLAGQPLIGKELDRYVNRQIEEVANPLMEHYGISLFSPDRWRHLCWCLLEEGGLITFAPPKERRRQRVWRDGRNKLVERMDKIVAKGKLTINAAARVLIAQHPEYRRFDRKSLANRYHEAKQALRPPALWPLEMRLKYVSKE